MCLRSGNGSLSFARGVGRIEHRMDGAEVGFVIFIFYLAVFVGALLGVVLLFQRDQLTRFSGLTPALLKELF